MKKIVYNKNNLKDSEINEYTRRAKAIITNKNGDILLCCTNNNYHLPGGHLEENESFEDCLVREIKEEIGIEIGKKERNQILSITHYNKDYPKENINTKVIENYYEIEEEIEPYFEKAVLTEDEKKGEFSLVWVNKDDIISFLYNSKINCTKEGVINDTLEAVKEYLNRNMTFSFLTTEQEETINLINEAFNYGNKYSSINLETNQRVLLLKDQNKVIGTTIITKKNDPIKRRKGFYLDYVAVSNNYQNRGLGTMMFQEIERIAKEEKIDYIELTSSKKRCYARKLYERQNMIIKDTDIFIKEL